MFEAGSIPLIGILFNSKILAVIASMEHTDSLIIEDAGLPVSENTKRIFLAISTDIPSFVEVLASVRMSYASKK